MNPGSTSYADVRGAPPFLSPTGDGMEFEKGKTAHRPHLYGLHSGCVEKQTRSSSQTGADVK